MPRAEIARRLHLSRNTVARYADMVDMSPEPPVPADRPHPAIGHHIDWIDGLLEADLGAPRKQRRTAKRVYDRLVEERGYKGSYSSVQRHVRRWRLGRATGAGDGFLELEWAPGTAQADYGNFEAVVAGERLRLKLLVACLPHSNARHAVAGMSQRSECMCAGLAEIFGRIGRAPREIVPGNATEAGRRVRGEVAESHLFSLFRAHYRMGGRYCSPYSGKGRGRSRTPWGTSGGTCSCRFQGSARSPS
ncbi:IS21 family transposase [Collinsella tanakaei]|uniref:IS21 family transposase n=1 Tax=Collinsella tanakaei TaxID=626935 RepID=UPI00195C31E5|nr:IS21 family transposase [Collinsella tanakaei]